MTACDVSKMLAGEKRVRIITGHYGSGKTEFAVNLALALADAGNKTALADLDIVNPYFRSWERRGLLEEKGIRVIVSSCGGYVDLPALTPEVMTIFQDESYQGVLDIGGDPEGAHVLGRYCEYLAETEFELYFVLNANRPETKTVEKALNYLRMIETASGQSVTGIVDNTHLCRETTVEELIKGIELSEAVADAAGVPVKYHVVEKRFIAALNARREDGICRWEGALSKLFPIDIYMKKPWEINDREEKLSWLDL